MRFSVTTLLVIVTVISALVAAIFTMPEPPSSLIFFSLLFLLPAITAMVAICGHDASRAFGIVATLFQLCFWSVFWLVGEGSFQLYAIRRTLYWAWGRELVEVHFDVEMRAWFVFVGMMTVLGGFVGAAIYQYWLTDYRHKR